MMKENTFFIEANEHFIKQTYRNRCHIAGPNGLQKLIIPLVHHDLSHTPVKDVQVSYDTPWQKIHFRSIKTAYSNAPFYEYFEDEFIPLFEKKEKFLLNLNNQILHVLFKIYKRNPEILFTKEFEKTPADKIDLRNAFNPKQPTKDSIIYHQVFADKNGFIPELSVVDYLFNRGRILDDKMIG